MSSRGCEMLMLMMVKEGCILETPLTQPCSRTGRNRSQVLSTHGRWSSSPRVSLIKSNTRPELRPLAFKSSIRVFLWFIALLTLSTVIVKIVCVYVKVVDDDKKSHWEGPKRGKTWHSWDSWQRRSTTTSMHQQRSWVVCLSGFSRDFHVIRIAYFSLDFPCY